MKAISKGLAAHIVKNSETPTSVNVIAYAIEAVLGELVKFITFAIIGWIFNCMVEMIVIVATYALLRFSTGGPHCTSYMRCFVLGIVTFTPLAVLATLATTKILAMTLLVSVLFTSFAIFQWVPGEWHQRKLKKPRESYQNITIIQLIVLHTITTILLMQSNSKGLMIALAIQLGVLWQFVSITPLGYKLIHLCDQLMIKLFSINKGGTVHDEA